MHEKSKGIIIISLCYVTAFAICALVFVLLAHYTSINHLVAILLADVAATIVIYLFGLLFRTASMYDPYWSVQTIMIYMGLLIYYKNFNLGTFIVFVVLLLYSVRLTGNFLKGFDSLSYEDWRYKMLKEKSGKLYQLVNFFGICMFPTLVVYLASIPVFLYARMGSFSYLDLIGAGVTVVGIAIELFADVEMKYFIKNRKDRSEVINFGIWKYSRHPNYLGEIIIWFGLGMMFIISHIEYWYFFAGAVVNLLMFLFISIPMEEKHLLSYKPDYSLYQKTTSPLLLLPKRKLTKEK